MDENNSFIRRIFIMWSSTPPSVMRIPFKNSVNIKMNGFICMWMIAMIFIWNTESINGLPTHNQQLNKNDGCYHNGTHYTENSFVPTMEPCLACKCSNRTLICALRICPEQPIPPPRGCIVVHKMGSCCPHLSCTQRHHVRPYSYSTDNRKVPSYSYSSSHIDPLEQHRITYGDNNLRRSDDEEFIDESGVCIHNGTVYRPGSAMSTSTLCSYCYCIGGRQKCVKPKCLLPQNGCRPVFINSACCPIRYDCTGKSDTVKTSNQTKGNRVEVEHKNEFTKTSTRSPRGRGCFINSHLYPEGQKLPVDTKSPCDICYCIRGAKKCTPKMCAPAIRKCTPVVKDGECCAASYDCSKMAPSVLQSSDSPRQFDFLSMLFGSEDGAENATIAYPEDRTPPELKERIDDEEDDDDLDDIESEEVVTDEEQDEPEDSEEDENDDLEVPSATEPSTITGSSTTTEKSFLDVLRDGLDMINNNGEKIGAIIDKNSPNATKPPPKKEPSLLDLLLGPDDDDEYEAWKNRTSTIIPPIQRPTMLTIHGRPPAMFYPELSYSEDAYEMLDRPPAPIIMRPSQAPPQMIEHRKNFTTQMTTEWPTSYESTTYDSSTMPVEATTEDNYSASDVDTTTDSMGSSTLSATETSTLLFRTIPPTISSTTTTTTRPTTTTGPTTTTTSRPTTKIIQTTQRPLTTTTHRSTTRQTTTPTTTTQSTTITTTPTTEKPPRVATSISVKSSVHAKPSTPRPTTVITKQTPHPYKPLSLSVNLESSMKLNDENPLHKIDTIPPQKLFESNAVRPQNNTLLIVGNDKIHTPKPNAHKPILNRNPSILESDYQYDYNEPTLPPSLPNLKIIPFLPADAVKPQTTDHKPHNYNFYKIKPPQTEVYENPDTFADMDLNNKRIDYDLYNPNPTVNYPSITSDKPTKYDGVVNYMKNKYPMGSVVNAGANNGGAGGDVVQYDHETLNYHQMDFSSENPLQLFKFSPPSRTEGGFRPREPVKDNYYYNNQGYHSTKTKNADLTTESPKTVENYSIGVSPITTSNPFRDVIKTEQAPDLDLLIVDKEKLLLGNRVSSNYSYMDNEDAEKEIISITTDSSYNITKMPLIENEHNSTVDKKDDGFFGSVLSFLFNDEDPPTPPSLHLRNLTESMTVPPFRTIPQMPSLDMFERKNDSSPIMITSSPGNIKELLAIEKVIVPASTAPIYSLGGSDEQTINHNNHDNSVKSSPKIDNINLLFPNGGGLSQNDRDDLDLILPSLTQNNHYPVNTETSSYQVLKEDDPTITNTESYVINPVELKNLEERHSVRPAEIFTKPATNSIYGGAGLLKLAGCNIYGRMYRVGKIISELSGPCLECRCTDIGVNCMPLDC